MKDNAQNALFSREKLMSDFQDFDKIERYTLKNGDDIEFHPFFARTKITEIITEFKSFAASEDEEDKKYMEMIQKDDLNITLFWYFLAVKKFTHFGEYMKDCKQVKDLMPYYDALLETGILEEIANDVFEYKELSKVMDMFVTEAALISASTEAMEKFAEEIKSSKEKFEKAIKAK